MHASCMHAHNSKRRIQRPPIVFEQRWFILNQSWRGVLVEDRTHVSHFRRFLAAFWANFSAFWSRVTALINDQKRSKWVKMIKKIKKGFLISPIASWSASWGAWYRPFDQGWYSSVPAWLLFVLCGVFFEVVENKFLGSYLRWMDFCCFSCHSFQISEKVLHNLPFWMFIIGEGQEGRVEDKHLAVLNYLLRGWVGIEWVRKTRRQTEIFLTRTPKNQTRPPLSSKFVKMQAYSMSQGSGLFKFL